VVLADAASRSGDRVVMTGSGSVRTSARRVVWSSVSGTACLGVCFVAPPVGGWGVRRGSCGVLSVRFGRGRRRAGGALERACVGRTRLVGLAPGNWLHPGWWCDASGGLARVSASPAVARRGRTRGDLVVVACHARTPRLSRTRASPPRRRTLAWESYQARHRRQIGGLAAPGYRGGAGPPARSGVVGSGRRSPRIGVLEHEGRAGELNRRGGRSRGRCARR
jgi:hypothetical protein